MENHAAKRDRNHTMNKAIFLAVLAAAIFLGACVVTRSASENDAQPEGISVMRHTDDLAVMDTLEKFNNPDNFFSTRKNFDIATFRKNAGSSSDYNFVREDGVHVRQIDFSELNNEKLRGYKEEFTRPDSHYRYSIMYTSNGLLSVMGADFCRNYAKEILHFDERGNIVKRKNVEGQFLPIEKLRKRFLEEKKIDIFNTETVVLVQRQEYEEGKEYYDIYVRNEPGSPRLTAYLLDALTGEFIFQAEAYRGRGIGPSAYNAYKEHLKSIGKTP
ncbi:MAG: hypothetical protein LBT81_01440 [Helicobacteraceae bacterium]|jgi:hypothetical protein|nr:hypothetical protein [Helicobacteraceae bacterium]